MFSPRAHRLRARLRLSRRGLEHVNWVLSLAPIFVVRDGLSALDALVAALAFSAAYGSRRRRHLGTTLCAAWPPRW